MKATADAIAEATRALVKQRRMLEEEKKTIDSELYRVEAAIKAIENAFTLTRIRRVTHDKVCVVCSQKFKAKTMQADICGKKECKKVHYKRLRKGVVLVPGDGTK